MIGVKVTPCKSTLMAWADFRHLLKEPTPEGEQEIYLDLIQNYKVILTSGASCLAEEPGWFRICFTYPYVGQRDDVTEAMGELKKRLL